MPEKSLLVEKHARGSGPRHRSCSWCVSCLPGGHRAHRLGLRTMAYITFRTARNFINGHGMRWNHFERVQSFTHPLCSCS